ncbi:hypothetical protein TNCV_309231 [Trichonephila clavipes]|nr:hypothetical protein TNCV_309231 [Trichonephila clavipes]
MDSSAQNRLTVIIKSEVSRLRQQSSALYLELRCSLCWNFVGGVGVTSREIQCDWLKPVLWCGFEIEWK